jgi:hypothetical protein
MFIPILLLIVMLAAVALAVLVLRPGAGTAEREENKKDPEHNETGATELADGQAGASSAIEVSNNESPQTNESGLPQSSVNSGIIPLPVFDSVPAWAAGLTNVANASAKTKTLDQVMERVKNFGAWTDFLVKGKEMGFRVAELTMLYKAAQDSGVKDYKTILWLPRALDRCIRSVLWARIQDGTLSVPNIEDFIFKLLRYRQSMELGKRRSTEGITSSRSMSTGQVIKILVPQVGVYFSRITSINRNNINIELPRGRELPLGRSWKLLPIEVYFWRKDDAGYYFESRVLNSPDGSLKPQLIIEHSDSLMRTQKRTSIRVPVASDGSLILLSAREDANEKAGGGEAFRCRIKDVSDSGIAVIIKGTLNKGQYVKVQLDLERFPVILCGEIKSVTNNKEKMISILHIEAIPPSKAMRIRILSYVMGISRVGKNAHSSPNANQDSVSKPETKISNEKNKPDFDETPFRTDVTVLDDMKNSDF